MKVFRYGMGVFFAIVSAIEIGLAVSGGDAVLAATAAWAGFMAIAWFVAGGSAS